MERRFSRENLLDPIEQIPHPELLQFPAMSGAGEVGEVLLKRLARSRVRYRQIFEQPIRHRVRVPLGVGRMPSRGTRAGRIPHEGSEPLEKPHVCGIGRGAELGHAEGANSTRCCAHPTKPLASNDMAALGSSDISSISPSPKTSLLRHRAMPKKIEPPFARGFRSRPISRILSRVTIHLGGRLPGRSSGVPGSSAGHVVGTCFALHRTGFGEPPCHHGAGGLLPHLFTLTFSVSGESLPAVSFLCHFPSAFAAWGFPSVLPFGVRTFLEPRNGSRSPGLQA